MNEYVIRWMLIGYQIGAIEIVKIAGKILRIEPKINYLPPRPGEIDNFVADTKKLQRLFGSVPDTGLTDGMMKTFGWVKH